MKKQVKPTPSNQLSLMSSLSPAARVLFQANALTVANYEMTPLQKNILYSVQLQLGADDALDKEYVIRIKDLAELNGVRNPYANLRQATKSMMQKIIEIPIDNNLLQIAPFSSVFYNTSEGTIAITIDPKLRPFLFNLENRFTTYGYVEASSLASRYSKRLYEMLSQWKNMGLMKVTVQELKTRLKLIKVDEEQGIEIEQYVDFDNFRRRVLDPAKREINESTDLQVEYYPEREGKKITMLKWTIKIVKKELQAPNPSELEMQLVEKFRLRPDQARYVLDNYETPYITRRLYEIEVINASRKITNMGGYTAKVFGVI